MRELDGDGLDPELGRERAHLAFARECLASMQAGAEALADYGVDALASESLGRLRRHRLAALAADPDAPPFFGRTDRDDVGLDSTADTDSRSRAGTDSRSRDDANSRSRDGTGSRSRDDANSRSRDDANSRSRDDANSRSRDDANSRSRDEVLHIGRRHVRDQALNPVVIDWRAPIARAFYRATPADRMGVTLRRRFGFGSGPTAGRLTSFEDEHLERGEAGLGLESSILRAEIERPRVGPMRDIVSTIQPDQDDLVRADLDTSLCIQGSPGTGKTAVGLHRAAYLLYSYPERLRRTGVLVVGPNAAFLRYIAQVLPALGEGGIAQATVDDLVADRPVRRVDPEEVAVIKGDARLALVLRRAVQSHVRKPIDDLVAVIGTKRYRVGAHHLRRYVDDARRQLAAGDLRWNTGRDRLRLQVAEDVRRQREAVGGAPTDSETRSLANSAAVRSAVEAVWPTLDAASLLARLYTDADFLDRCADVLTADERTALRWTDRPRTIRAARWSAADRVLLDELHGILDGTESFVHVVVDEAQDLSAMQCRVVARRSPLGSLTVLGDLAQATTAWAPGSWPATLTHLGRPDADVRPLTVGYRVPGEVLALANRLLPHIAPDLAPASSVRAGADALSYASGSDLVGVVTRSLAQSGSIGVICADLDEDGVLAELRAADLPVAPLSLGDEAEGGADRRITVVPAGSAKGLEFDAVVLVEPEAIVAAEPSRLVGLRRLYVALTRAVSRLVIVHGDPLPRELAASPATD